MLFLASVSTLFAEVNPFYKEVLQRGFEISPGDSVLFPDGTKCLIEDFNQKKCGQDWFNKPYCVSEGNKVWDTEVCCEGLAPYLAAGSDGQSTCQPIDNSWFSSKTILYFFLGVLIPLGLFVFLAYKAKRGLPKK